ncbi:6447_t:CDS:1, partial [Scutellospora calospora]
MTGCFIIDENKYDLIKTYTWSAKKSRGDKTIYVSTNINNDPKRVTILLHRLLLDSKEGDEVDHVNGDGLDNRLNNIHKTTHVLNMKNKHKGKGEMDYKVFYDKDKLGFMVECKNNVYKLFKGKFDNDELFKEAV